MCSFFALKFDLLLMDDTRFVDRDMFMRYIGGGIGHCCSQTDTHAEEDEEMEGISIDDDGGSCEGGEGVDDIASEGPLDEELGHQPAEVYEDNEGEDSDSEDSNENSSDEDTDFDAEDDGFDNL
jgi:hypothetical protein